MKFSSLSKAEKICIIGIGILFFVFILCLILLFWKGEPIQKDKQEQLPTIEDTSDALEDELDRYPDQIQLDEPMPELSFFDKAGNEVSLANWKGKNVLILFWTSWCKYCKEELENFQEYAELLKEYENVELILLNKLDGEKETKEKALEYLEDNKISIPTYFDENLTVYNKLGVKIVPTLIGINEMGVLKVCKPGLIDGRENMAALIEYVMYGGSYQTEKFVTEQLTSEEGGVHVNYLDTDKESPSGFDVLSESQGIMMEYAVLKNNQELFERYYQYVTSQMLISDSLAGWMVTADGPAKVNALLDDLRIYRALNSANQLWGGYEEELDRWEKSIIRYNISNHKFVDYYDFQSKRKANRFTLCYADFEAMSMLKQANSKYSKAYDNAYQIVTGGYISNEFPFYYSWYDYKKKEYMPDDLNMAETMYTLLHLARIGELKKETVTWLEKALDENGVKARYSIEGEVVEGYEYESTAIYAFIAMIGDTIGNQKLKTKAIARMEFMRVNNKNVIWNGAFSHLDGTDIYSFDQCIPLLMYAMIEEAK